MKSQPNRDYVSNDDVQTPDPMALAIVQHFRIRGSVLEPCRGGGAFYRAFEKRKQIHHQDFCEIKEGYDFVGRLGAHQAYIGNGCHIDGRYAYVATNPPWSLIRPFLQRSMQIADNVVFLMTINHAWTKARVRDAHQAGFGMKEILLVDMPKSFPQSGFQLGAVHWQRGWTGDIKLSRL